MSTPKAKSPLSNLQLVSDEEVAVSLQRLIDSVVVEVTAHRSALQPQQIMSSNDEALNINSLPEEMLINIFSHLSQNELGRIARVCRRWCEVTRRPTLWKKVNVHFSPSHKSQTTVAEYFVNVLPPCVTHLRLDFNKRGAWIGRFNFEEISVKLKEKCPDVKALILQTVVLTDNLSTVIDFCSLYLRKVEKLAFHFCDFHDCLSEDKCDIISKIEFLELKFCGFKCLDNPPFSKLPYLKELRLHGTMQTFPWFRDDISFISQLHVLDLGYVYINFKILQEIQNHGLNLTELYLCGPFLDDIDLNNFVLPHLKTICLWDCVGVTCDDVVSLIQSCPSLDNVYVDEDVAESFAVHRFVVANRCKKGIVKSININHTHFDLLKHKR